MESIKILAKSKSSITLKEHTRGLLEQLKNLKKFLENKQNFDYDLLELTIFVHDLGKVLPAFQISVGNWDYSPKVLLPDIPHSIFFSALDR